MVQKQSDFQPQRAEPLSFIACGDRRRWGGPLQQILMLLVASEFADKTTIEILVLKNYL
jgi:hypothetical protein